MNLLKNLVKKFLNFCFSFKGRLNRKAFFFSWLKLVGLTFACAIIVALMAALSALFPIYLKIPILLLAIIGVLGLIVIIIGMVGIQIRRLHDLNFSGWWLLLIMLSTMPGSLAMDPKINLPLPDSLRTILIVLYFIAALCWLIGFFFIKGSKGENKYGKDPLESSEA